MAITFEIVSEEVSRADTEAARGAQPLAASTERVSIRAKPHPLHIVANICFMEGGWFH